MQECRIGFNQVYLVSVAKGMIFDATTLVYDALLVDLLFLPSEHARTKRESNWFG
jgi:hypothetical protein